MKLRLFVIVLLVAVGGAAVFVSLGGLPPSSGSASAEYLTATAVVDDVTAEVAATGTIAASETWALGFGAPPLLVVDAAAAIAGSGSWTVTGVAVEPGSAVAKGDTLATASTADLRAQLRIARTSRDAALVQERMAVAALDDAEDAGDTTTIRQAKISHKNAVNGRRQAQEEVADLEEQVALATLTAPIDGIVTVVNAVEGQSSSGTAITISSNTFEVTTDVVEGDISGMATGQAATVTVDAIEATIAGEVSAIAPSAGTGSGTSSVVSFPVTVTLSGAPSALRAGMTAEVTIVSASAADVLTVPSSALRGSAGDYRVQVLGADGVPVVRPVTVGLVTESAAEITDGLTAGEVVVTGTASDRTATDAGTTVRGGGIAIPGGGSGPRGNFGQP